MVWMLLKSDQGEPPLEESILNNKWNHEVPLVLLEADDKTFIAIQVFLVVPVVLLTGPCIGKE
jgi:hypothetical protein